MAVAPALGRRLRRYADRGRPTDVHTDRLFLTTRRSPKTAAFEPLNKRTTEVMCKSLAERPWNRPEAGLAARPPAVVLSEKEAVERLLARRRIRIFA